MKALVDVREGVCGNDGETYMNSQHRKIFWRTSARWKGGSGRGKNGWGFAATIGAWCASEGHVRRGCGPRDDV